jgi:hypothetical protein
MKSQIPQLYPVFAMVLLTALVWAKMLKDRVSEIIQHKVRVQSLATRNQARANLTNLQSADNFNNLCELPVLFYLLSTLVFVTQSSTSTLLFLGWSFVFFRAAHSYIQCTYNKVQHRFRAYFLSSLALWISWAIFIFEILSHH